MSLRVGILAEGNDHLILHAYLAKLLNMSEGEIEADFPDGTGHGWQYVERTVDIALRRFYHRCAQLVVLSMDNDAHPRHWLHHEANLTEECRWCRLQQSSEATRPHLNWNPTKAAATWPIIIAVPVETIEAWLLTTRAILTPGAGSLTAEQEPRAAYKQRFYGRPTASLEGVESIALPLIRQLEPTTLQALKERSCSFADFAGQVENSRDEIITAPPCW